MGNELRVDLSDPSMQEAFAECNPGETHTITMDIRVTENGEELIADVDPESVEKYSDDGYEKEEYWSDAEPKAVAIIINNVDPKQATEIKDESGRVLGTAVTDKPDNFGRVKTTYKDKNGRTVGSVTTEKPDIFGNQKTTHKGHNPFNFFQKKEKKD
jgi:hypothetical protein|tara:strand:- start:289 stop:759 length:471 start_codon:yes stop_codon:yes gene_type:complete